MRALLAMVKANLKMNVRNRQALFWNLAFPDHLHPDLRHDFRRRPTPSTSRSAWPAIPPRCNPNPRARSNRAMSSMSMPARPTSELKALDNGDRDYRPRLRAAARLRSAPGQVRLRRHQRTNLHHRDQRRPPGAADRGAGLQPGADHEATDSTHNITYIDFFIPGILAMSLMNSGVIGLSTAFVTYRERGFCAGSR